MSVLTWHCQLCPYRHASAGSLPTSATTFRASRKAHLQHRLLGIGVLHGATLTACGVGRAVLGCSVPGSAQQFILYDQTLDVFEFAAACVDWATPEAILVRPAAVLYFSRLLAYHSSFQMKYQKLPIWNVGFVPGRTASIQTFRIRFW
jgi:hypothetical protein